MARKGNDYRYKDTKNHSFDDFEKIIELCYKNNIKLDIIIGPSHIRQWEALDLYLGYENWLQWKKDMVISLDKVSKNYKNSRYKIVDFATYNGFTTEKIPKNPKLQMKYYWESSHYNNDLGKIVIDKLQNSVKVKEEKFGIEINLLNIDKYIQQLREDRIKYIDIIKYGEKIKYEKYNKSYLHTNYYYKYSYSRKLFL